MLVNRLLPLVLVLSSMASAAVRYPFPYFANYPFGLRSTMDVKASISSKYASWKNDFIEECSDGTTARVLWKDSAATAESCNATNGDCTASEGIASAMLIAVYMDNDTTNAKALFDKLWAYYKKYPSNGMMHWLVRGCSGGVVKTGAKTAADLDVATALAMAYKQWGDQKYLTGATTLLGNIWGKEIGNGLVKPDDQGTGDLYNPSYFSIGALRMFKTVDASHDWTTVANTSLAMAKKNQNATTGFNSDWCNSGATPISHSSGNTTQMGYDAVHTSWRIALDYLWYGTADAKIALDKMYSFVSSTRFSGGSIETAYALPNLDGSASSSNTNSAYTGAYTMSGVANSAARAWVDSGTKKLAITSGESYRNRTWQLLYLLTLSGSFQNYWGAVAANQATVSAPIRNVPQGWNMHVTSNAIRIEVPGSATALLVDVMGVVVGSASGEKVLEMAKPARAGIYFAVIRSEGKQVNVPVAHQ